MNINFSNNLLNYMKKNNKKDIIIICTERKTWGGGVFQDFVARFATYENINKLDKTMYDEHISLLGTVYVPSKLEYRGDTLTFDINSLFFMKKITVEGLKFPFWTLSVNDTLISWN